MEIFRKLLVGVFVLGVLLSNRTVVSGGPVIDDDEALLRDAGVDPDPGLLLNYLRGRTLTRIDAGLVDKLVRRLGHDRAGERELAARELVRLVKFSREQLKRASAEKDPEIAARAKECLRQIERQQQLGVIRVAARVLVKHRQAGALEILLKLLPEAEDDNAEAELYYGLETLAVDKGEVAPTLLKALRDAVPAQRAVAACIIGWRGNAEQRTSVRKLLDDASASVRLRAAQGLLAGGDKSALPALVALLDDKDVTLAWQAEELLRWTAGKTAPDAVLGAASTAERRRCRASWKAWQGKYAAGVNLVERRKDGRRPGLLWLSSVPSGSTGLALLWVRGCDGKPRWQWKGKVARVQFLPPNRVLLSEDREEFFPTISERDLEGKVLPREFPKQADKAYRLRDGHTLFMSGWDMYEVNEAGKRLTVKRPSLLEPEDFKGVVGRLVRPLARGRLAWWGRGQKMHRIVDIDHTTGQCRRMVTLPVDPEDNLSVVGVTDKGHFFLSHFAARDRQAEVLELDTAGKVVWRSRTPEVASAEKLANGNVILASRSLAFGMPAVIEVDRAGRKVWEDFPPRVVREARVCLPLVRFGFDQPADAPVDLDSFASRLEGLKDKDPVVRYRSAGFLQEMGTKAEPALEALFQALEGMNASQIRKVREAAADVLLPKSWPVVRRAARDKSTQVRAAAVGLLYKFRDCPRVAAPVLLAAFNDADARVRREAAGIANNFVGEKEVVVALSKALKDKDVAEAPTESVAYQAAHSLGCPGPHAKIAALALVEATKTGPEQVRLAATRGLGTIVAKDAAVAALVVPRLIAILKNTKEKGSVRGIAAHSLSCIGPSAKAAVPVLRAMVTDHEAEDYESAMAILGNSLSALGAIGSGASAAVPELLIVLNDKRGYHAYRSVAAEALGKIGPAAQAAVGSLASMQWDERLPKGLREAAGTALRKIALPTGQGKRP